jgi:hypothetical protein
MYVNAKWDLLKLFQELGGEGTKKHGGRGWIQVWYIWYIVRTFINATKYPHQAQHKKKKTTENKSKYDLVQGCKVDKTLENQYNTIYDNYVYTII